MSTYVSSTDPSPFHQIIVLSQRTINDCFKRMWEISQMDDEESPLRHFKTRLRGSGEYLDADIGVPEVQLQVTTNDPMLYFRLRLKNGGVLRYLSDDEDDDRHIEWSIDDWVFAFSVRISRKEITKDGPEYRKFKDRAGLPNSNFSLAQLFIDSSSSTKWSEELSNFGDKDSAFRNLAPDARSTFESFIDKWLTKMKNRGCNILGYSALRDGDGELNRYEPTFPPTSIDYDCYPWRSGRSDTNRDNQDMNALCYLMMSRFESPPIKAISYSGQFIDSDHDSTFVMNRSLFWPWMHSVLRQVVIDMIPVPDTPYLEWNNSDEDHPYRGDGPGQWKWQSRSLSTEKAIRNPYRSSDSGTITERLNPQELRAILGADGGTLAFNPGTETMTLDGRSIFLFNVNHYSTKDTYTSMSFTLTWKITIRMSAVEAGGLEFIVDDLPSHVEATSEGNLSWSRSVDEIRRDLAEDMASRLRSAIQNAEDDLRNALAHQHRLFLPGAGSFLMKDPTFNNNGDLMVKLAYNGADPPPPPQK